MEITVATLNLRHDADRWEERFPLIIAELARDRPHVVGLQEVSVRQDQARLLAAELNEALAAAGDTIRYGYVQRNKTGSESEVEGIAVLSRLPIVEHDWLDLRTFNRVALRARLELSGGRTLHFYTTHFHYRQEDNEVRLAQAQLLHEWMTGHRDGSPQVLVGDFNALPDQSPIRFLAERYLSAFRAAHGQEPEYTFPTPLVNRGAWRGTLDYIFITPHSVDRPSPILDARLAFNVHAEHDPALYPSDHFGVTARLRF
jgi:endonuclease/exonuclease/phosphatase family metal-dependent hydrolase